MDVEPNDLLLFARVMDAGSFTGAAERLGLPKSTVSRRLAALEAALGERLLLRTTRRLTLTDFGANLLVHARQVADEVDAAASLALHRQARPGGRLKVSMPSEAFGIDIERVLAALLLRYPEIVLDVDMSSRRVDLIAEGFDLAIRMGALPDDATLVARRLYGHGWGLFASPVYLALRGTPRAPADLLAHDGIALRGRGGEAAPWALRRGGVSGGAAGGGAALLAAAPARDAEQWTGLPALRALVNSPRLMLDLALADLGIAALPMQVARAPLDERRLVPLLADWSLPCTDCWAVMPGRRLMPAKTRVLIEAIEAAVQEAGLA
ncbi:LysR family transcriptional regulator [Derxia gummosa]|uniref:LysR family transcriptional regulator n=1 Tax=Derxia gummosa DSM 723 TaxID=1121388 RepID=A0A8B6X5Z6_9BURK|nr:LysR family transcriptional regulator [Derxia gummosa]